MNNALSDCSAVPVRATRFRLLLPMGLHTAEQSSFFAPMYAKIFQQIYDSSIAEDPKVRFTFMDLIVLADSDGVVDMTHEAIARRTNVPIEWVRSSIAALEASDEKSRSPEHNGARLVRIDEHRDWGWVIVNFDRFRSIATDQQRREKTKLRVQKHREKPANTSDSKPVTQCNTPVTPPYASASACVSVPKEGGTGETKPMIDQKTEFQNRNRLEWLWEKLCDMYKRPTRERRNYIMETTLVAVATRPSIAAELESILSYRPKVEQKYFPQSLDRLLEKWDEVLDRARNHVKPGGRSMMEKESASDLARINKLE